MWLLGSPDRDSVSVHLAIDVEYDFIREDQSFYETILLHFQLHLLAKFMPFHFVCWCKGLHQHILHGLKHSRSCNTFHTIIFSMPNSLFALDTDLQELRLTHSFNVVIRHTRLTRTPAFAQASSFHKLSVGTTWLHYSCVVRFF
jgi:hypothetical protein